MRQHDGASDREQGEEQPQGPGPVPPGVRHPVPGDVEDSRPLGDLGGHGDREEEHDDRQQALEQRDGIRSRHGGTTSRTHGARALAGSCSRTSKAPATTSAQRRHRPRRHAGRAEVTRHEPAGVLGHVAGAGHPHLHPAGGEVGTRAPRGGIRAPTGSRPRRRARRRPGAPVQGGPPDPGERAEPGQRGAHRQAVGGDPVTGPHRAVQGRDDDEPAVRPAASSGVERGQPERVVEHAGVDLGGRGGRCGVEHEVAGDLVEQAGGDAEQGVARRGSG